MAKTPAKRKMDRRVPGGFKGTRTTEELTVAMYDILYEIMDQHESAISIRIVRYGLNGQVIMNQQDSCTLLAAALAKKLW